MKTLLSKGAIEELYNIGNNQPVPAGKTISHQTAEELLKSKMAMHYDGEYVLTEYGKEVLLEIKMDAAKKIAKGSAVNRWAKRNY